MSNSPSAADVEGLEGRDLVAYLHPEASAGHVHKAAVELGELARYLVHATLSERRAVTLPHPAALDRLAQDLRLGLSMLPQLFMQIAARLEAMSADPWFSTDDGDAQRAAERAVAAQEGLRAVADQLGDVVARLDRAAQNTSHLKFD